MTEQFTEEQVEAAPHVEETESAELANVEEEDTATVEETEEVSSDNTTETDENFIPETEMSDRVKKRISRLTWEKHEAERQAKAEAEALRAELEALKKAQPQVEAPKPTMAQFDYDEEKYAEALVDWKVEQRIKGLQPQAAPDSKLAEEQAQAQAWQQKAAKYAENNPEYIELVQQRSNALTSHSVASYIASSEAGTKLHHHLLDNFSELARIQQLPEWQQGAELAKIEAGLNRVKAKAKSKAPEPVKPLQGAAPRPAGDSSPFPTNW